MVVHRSRARQFLYRASVTVSEVRLVMVAELTDRLFDGDVAALMSHLLTARAVSPGDLAKVKEMVEAHESKKEVGRDEN